MGLAALAAIPPNSHALLQWAMAGLRAVTSLPRDRHKQTDWNKTKDFENGKQNGVNGRRLRLGLVFCHGAHTREEQGHADEDVTQIIIFNDIKAGQGRTQRQDTLGSNESTRRNQTQRQD